MKNRPSLPTAKIILIKIILPLSFSFVFGSCDSPTDSRRVRFPTSSSSDNNNSENYNNNSNGRPAANESYSQGNTNQGGNEIGNSNLIPVNQNGSSIPAEFSHCNIQTESFQSSHSLIGNYNICLSRGASRNRLLFQLQYYSSSFDICIFPMGMGSNNYPIMIGAAQCLKAAGSIDRIITLYANRQGFTNSPITGVMIVQNAPYEGGINGATYPSAFADCMRILYQTQNPQYCEDFKMRNKYIFAQLP